MGNSIREDDATCPPFMWQTWLYRDNQRAHITATIIKKGNDFRDPEKLSEKGVLKNPEAETREADIETNCIHLHVYEGDVLFMFQVKLRKN